MNLYLLEQNINNTWDTFDSCVVAAKSEEDAKTITPGGCPRTGGWDETWVTRPDDVKATLIGKARKGTERGLIIASFNAG